MNGTLTIQFVELNELNPGWKHRNDLLLECIFANTSKTTKVYEGVPEWTKLTDTFNYDLIDIDKKRKVTIILKNHNGLGQSPVSRLSVSLEELVSNQRHTYSFESLERNEPIGGSIVLSCLFESDGEMIKPRQKTISQTEQLESINYEFERKCENMKRDAAQMCLEMCNKLESDIKDLCIGIENEMNGKYRSLQKELQCQYDQKYIQLESKLLNMSLERKLDHPILQYSNMPTICLKSVASGKQLRIDNVTGQLDAKGDFGSRVRFKLVRLANNYFRLRWDLNKKRHVRFDNYEIDGFGGLGDQTILKIHHLGKNTFSFESVEYPDHYLCSDSDGFVSVCLGDYPEMSRFIIIMLGEMDC